MSDTSIRYTGTVMLFRSPTIKETNLDIPTINNGGLLRRYLLFMCRLCCAFRRRESGEFGCFAAVFLNIDDGGLSCIALGERGGAAVNS